MARYTAYVACGPRRRRPIDRTKRTAVGWSLATPLVGGIKPRAEKATEHGARTHQDTEDNGRDNQRRNRYPEQPFHSQGFLMVGRRRIRQAKLHTC